MDCPAIQTLDQAPQSVCLHCVVSLHRRRRRSNTVNTVKCANTTNLVPQNLLLGDPVESLNVSNNDSDYEVDHDDGPQEDDAYQ